MLKINLGSLKGKIPNCFRKDPNKIDKQWLLLSVIVAVLVIALILVSVFFFFEARYYQRFFPGSLLGNINLEGLTFDEAYSLVEKSANDLEDQGIKIQKNNASLLVKSVSDSSSPDVAQTIFSLDSHTALTKAFTFGRDKSWWENLLIQVRMFFQTKRFEMDYDMNREVLTQMIKVQFSSSEKNELAARPEISLVNGSWQVEILPEETGMILDMEKALNDFEGAIILVSHAYEFVEQIKIDQTLDLGANNTFEK